MPGDQLPIFGDPATSLDERYREWRETDDGVEVFHLVEQMALTALYEGKQRIEVNLLYAQVRETRRQSADNSFRALIARELIAKHPPLGALIEVRKRPTESAA